MNLKKILTIITVLTAALSFAQNECDSRRQTLTSAEEVLEAISKASEKLESLSADITYSLIEDPDIFETKMTYTGSFNYLKTDDRQYAMIEFLTRQEDDFPVEQSRQAYIFDGVWLTRIDYQLKQVSRDRLAPDDEPEDVFKLISDDFPLIGFSETDTLGGIYEIEFKDLAKKGKDLYQLTLTPKDNLDDDTEPAKYSSIRFTINRKTLLPVTIKSVSSEDNSIYDINLKNPVVNEELDKKIFNPELPEDFTYSISRE